jgi:CheY-like chemotaxis protein
LEVKDNGCGMSEETVKRLFDPFFSTKLTGRGLGMSAVMGIMKSHGGALFVESEVSKGTTFRVLFPVTESAGPAATQPHPDPDRLPEGEGILREGTKSSPERCDIQEVQFSGLALLVDDEKNVLKTCTKMVKLCGFEVITACDGFDAVAKFREHANEIDVVLMDLTMPNMGGIEAMGEIYSTRRDARVILSSGFNKEELSGRIAGQPPSGFIRKPYSMGELEAELLRVMQGVLITTTGEQHNGDDR